MNLEIVEAKVILTKGTDKVFLQTKLPCPFTKDGLPSQPDLYVTFDATYDTGIDYCINHLGITPTKIIDTR